MTSKKKSTTNAPVSASDKDKAKKLQKKTASMITRASSTASKAAAAAKTAAASTSPVIQKQAALTAADVKKMDEWIQDLYDMHKKCIEMYNQNQIGTAAYTNLVTTINNDIKLCSLFNRTLENKRKGLIASF